MKNRVLLTKTGAVHRYIISSMPHGFFFGKLLLTMDDKGANFTGQRKPERSIQSFFFQDNAISII